MCSGFLKEPIMTKEEYDLVVEILKNKKRILIFKRIFDIITSYIMSVIFSPLLLIFSVMILVDSGAPVFFRQERMGKNSKTFRIFKFRTMRNNTATADGITVANDNRITKLGSFLRKYRLDEIPQLFNIIKGEMSFVGPRPDLPKYYMVNDYGYKCVLLVKPGITGLATLVFKDEDKILALCENPETAYIEDIFPNKVKLNIDYIKKISILNDLKGIFETVLCVFVQNGEKKNLNI